MRYVITHQGRLFVVVVIEDIAPLRALCHGYIVINLN